MTAAIFGFVGVVVGGLLTFGADLYKSWRAERGRARVAARLVIREFRVMDAQLDHCLNYGYRWPADRFEDFRWPEHEPVLAAAVTDQLEWRKMEDVFSVLTILEVLGDGLHENPSPQEETTQRHVLATLRSDMTEAGQLLGKWAA